MARPTDRRLTAARPSVTGLLTASLASGASLGLLQLLPALGLDGSWVGPARLLGGLALLAALFAAWRGLPSVWSALAGGLLAGLGYFGVALHWLGSSANPDPTTFVPREALLTLGSLCLFVPWWGVWFAAGHLLARLARAPAMAPLAFALSFAFANLALGDVVMELPVAPLSLLSLDTPATAVLRLVGQLGLDVALVLAGALLGQAVLSRKALTLGALPLAVGLLVAPWPAPLGSGASPSAGLVYLAQPSLPHVSTLPPDEALGIVHEALLDQIGDGVASGARLIVLPEGAFLSDLTVDEELVSRIAAMLPPDTYVLGGFTLARTLGTGADIVVRPYNSSMLIGPEGEILAHNKAHLVPFGETMPSIFFRLGFDVVAGPSGGYEHGPTIGNLGDIVPLPPFSLVICFEGLLTGAVSRETDEAQWLLNISAEKLFRGTVGPRLLLDHMRLRAIETGLPVLRSTAHAYSAAISAEGTVLAALPAEAATGLLVPVPEARPTTFRDLGYAPLRVVMALGLAVLIGSGTLAWARTVSLPNRSRPQAA